MALTRKMLKAMGIEEEKIDQIIEMHGETVDALKAQIAAAKENGKPAEDKEKPKADKPEDSDAYKKLKADFDKYKADAEAKEAKAAKEKAARAYFTEKGVAGKNLEIAIRGARAEIDALELNDGKIKDSKALDDLLAGDYSGLVVKTETGGVKTPTPPASTGKPAKTKEEIMKIKDDKERWTAMQENPSLFGLDK